MNRINAFVLLSLFALSSIAWGANWELAVIFLGQQESSSYHKDIDYNILELSQFKPRSDFKLSIFRGFGSRWYTYQPDPRANAQLTPWDDLFFQVPHSAGGPMNGVLIPGHINSQSGPAKLFLDPKKLKNFLARAFTNPRSKRLLIIYGHGKAYSGLRQVDLIQLEQMLANNLPKRSGKKALDIAWFNSCFMGSIEVANQIKALADYLIVSQDAEFASAAPALDQKDIFSNSQPKEVAVKIARQYLESYSSTWKGSQRRYIVDSPATLSVIETSKIKSLVLDIKKIVQKIYPLPSQTKRQLRTNLAQIAMQDRDDLVDMGFLFRVLARSRSVSYSAREALKKLSQKYGFWKLPRRNTSPRVKIKKGKTIVYGFSNWNHGNKADSQFKYPKDLIPDGFVRGENGKLWPFKTFKKGQRIVPFTTQHQEFNFYHYDIGEKKRIGELETVSRLYDLALFSRTKSSSPILFNGYTESIGKFSERYSGLNILSPIAKHLDGRYFDTDFSTITNWQQLTQ